MSNSVKSSSYVVALLLAMTFQAAVANPFEAVAKEQGRQAVASAMQLLRAELEASMGQQPGVHLQEAAGGSAAEEVLATALAGTVSLAEQPCGSSAPAE
jgi:hypothetical protein